MRLTGASKGGGTSAWRYPTTGYHVNQKYSHLDFAIDGTNRELVRQLTKFGPQKGLAVTTSDLIESFDIE